MIQCRKFEEKCSRCEKQATHSVRSPEAEHLCCEHFETWRKDQLGQWYPLYATPHKQEPVCAR